MKKILAIVLALCTVFALVACGGSGNSGDGQYSGTAKGMGGDVTVTLTIENGKITDCTAEGKKESEKIGAVALETLTEAVKSSGSIGVDIVSGATMSSEAFLAAAEEAITKAGLNVADFQ